MDVRLSLRIKYGLKVDPTEVQVRQWAQATAEAIAQGESPEAAGREAARRLFTGVGSVKYAAEADTIVALLEAIRRREGSNG